MRILTQRALFLAALMIAGLLTLSPLTAENSTTEFAVPFQFSAGDAILPAGDYQVGIDQTFGRISVTASDLSTSHYLLPHRISASGTDLQEARVALVFHRYGDTYFLREVWRNGREQGFAISETKAEKQAARQGNFRQVALIHPR